MELARHLAVSGLIGLATFFMSSMLTVAIRPTVDADDATHAGFVVGIVAALCYLAWG